MQRVLLKHAWQCGRVLLHGMHANSVGVGNLATAALGISGSSVSATPVALMVVASVVDSLPVTALSAYPISHLSHDSRLSREHVSQ